MPSRAEAITRRQSLLAAEITTASRCITRQLPPILKSVSAIVGYYPHHNEPNLLRMYRWCRRHHIGVYLPSWTGQGYTPLLWDTLQPDELVRGPYGILNPPSNNPVLPPNLTAAWLVPGLWFTKTGHRMGYGKGIYDQLLSKWGGIKIGIGYEWQVIDAVPQHPGDYPLDYVVTDLKKEAT